MFPISHSGGCWLLMILQRSAYIRCTRSVVVPVALVHLSYPLHAYVKFQLPLSLARVQCTRPSHGVGSARVSVHMTVTRVRRSRPSHVSVVRNRFMDPSHAPIALTHPLHTSVSSVWRTCPFHTLVFPLSLIRSFVPRARCMPPLHVSVTWVR